MRSAFRCSLFWAITEAIFLQGAFCLPEIILTLAGAMTSITFTILELKVSTRSSVEHGEGGSNMAFLKSAVEYSLIYRFLIVFDSICMSGIKNISKKTQKWSEREGWITEISETVRPFVIIKWVQWVAPFTCWQFKCVQNSKDLFCTLIIQIISMKIKVSSYN